MAADHERLYEELIADRGGHGEEATGSPRAKGEGPQPSPLSIASANVAPLLDDRELREKIQRRFASAGDGLDAIVLADAGPAGRFSFRTLPPDDSPPDLLPHTVIWRREIERNLPQGLPADPEATVASTARLLSGAGFQLEWRHLAAPDPVGSGQIQSLPASEPLPGAGEYRVPRWELTPTWVPPSSRLAIRYCKSDGERRLVSGGEAPAGFEPEHTLGSLRDAPFQGTAKLIEIDGTYRAIPEAEREQVSGDAIELGYIELAPLPGMDPLSLAVHRTTEQHLLVCSADDPLLAEVDQTEHLGFLDPVPLKPRQIPQSGRPLGILGLVKAVDYAARRLRYAIGSLPEGEPIAELGGLAESPLQGPIPAWIVDGYLVTDRHRPPATNPSFRGAVRWAAAPVAWHGLASAGARAKVVARRSRIAAGRLRRTDRRSTDPPGEPAGWLFERARPGLVTLFAAYHPITGDQLLSRDESSATHLGYRPPELLGYVSDVATLTGDLNERPLSIPWARRFGHVPRPG